MKRFAIIVLFVFTVFLATQVMAQDDNNFYDQFQQYAGDQIDAIAKPIVEAFGTGIGGGLYNTASTHGLLGFDLGFRAMMVMIPEGKSAIFDSSDVKFFPVPVAQASVGLPMGFEVMARGFSAKFQDGTISLFGGGVKKNFNSYIPVPGLPDISAMIAYHTFKAGDILSSNTLSMDVLVSKKFLIITPYGGFGFDRTSMDIKYTYIHANPVPPPTNLETQVKHNIKVSTGRFTVGLNITPFPFVKIFADYNLGKFSQATAGLAISFR
jgi:hypothetical protein